MRDPLQSPLETRLRELSRELCYALNTVLSEALGVTATGGPIRPILMTNQLGLDRTLASRIARALREPDELRGLYGLPTPQGLQLVERATKGHGASEEALAKLRSATESYGEMLASFRGGRGGLETTLAGWIPELRAKAERNARRTVFRGMSTLEGTQTGMAYAAIFLIPSKRDPERLDALVITIRADVCRLRVGESIPLVTISASGSNHWFELLTDLDGQDLESNNTSDRDPQRFLVEELCSQPTPALATVHEGESVTLEVVADALDVNVEATLGLAWRIPSFFVSYQSGANTHCHVSVKVLKPTERQVVDLFFHKDAMIQGEPVASVSKQLSVHHDQMHGPPPETSPERMLAPTVERRRDSASTLANQDVPFYGSVVDTLKSRAGLDVSDFTLYRTSIDYPLVASELILWWPTLKRPDESD